MCSISGYLRRDPTHVQSGFTAAETLLTEIIPRATDRGRDSCGVAGVDPEHTTEQIHLTASGTELAAQHAAQFTDAQVVINNNRAEPTTEYVAEKRLTDVQPFTDAAGRYWATHNGTIANDAAIASDFDLHPDTEIDTAVIPGLLAAVWDGTLRGLRDLLDEHITGSYAFAIIDRERPDRLFLACNYKPLHLVTDTIEEIVYFSSFDDYLPQPDGDLNKGRYVHRALDPYTVVEVTPHSINSLDLDQSNRHDERALVIASGGLDSTTVAKVMQDEGYEVELLHFTYGARAEDSEVEAIEAIADRLGTPLTFMPTDFMRTIVGGSKLTDTGGDVEIADGEAGAEFAIEWVPARNFVMLAIATAYAEAHDHDVIALGNNLEEAGAYPDNEMEFINRIEDALPYATSADKHVRIEQPVGNLMKHEIVSLGLDHDAPLDLTWSCYEDGELHCGDCGPCFMRKTAFEIADRDEVIDYETSPSTETETETEIPQ